MKAEKVLEIFVFSTSLFAVWLTVDRSLLQKKPIVLSKAYAAETFTDLGREGVDRANGQVVHMETSSMSSEHFKEAPVSPPQSNIAILDESSSSESSPISPVLRSPPLLPFIAQLPQSPSLSSSLPSSSKSPVAYRRLESEVKNSQYVATWIRKVNYSKPSLSDWPQCSSRVDNCLPTRQTPLNHGCERWRNIADYPVLVGDMDGSGSRGLTWLMRAGGIWMRTTNEWLDWAKSEHPLSNKIMETTHSVDYRVKQLPDVKRIAAENLVKSTLREFANVAQTQLGKWSHRNLKPWEKGLDSTECPRRIGWKHGQVFYKSFMLSASRMIKYTSNRSDDTKLNGFVDAFSFCHRPLLFLQPVYESITQGRHTFVHLIRDGRDMAFSRNRNNLAKYPKYGGQVVGLFKLGKTKNFNKCFFKPNQKHTAESDRTCMLMQMRLWEKMNLHAARYGVRELGLRYVPIKIEDLILPDEVTRAETVSYSEAIVQRRFSALIGKT